MEVSHVPVDPSAVDAVVFDVGGVFIYPDPASIRDLARRRGITLGMDDLDFVRAHHAGCRALTLHGDAVDERSQLFWAVYDRAYLSELGLADVECGAVAVALEAAWSWPHERNVAALHRLAAAGVPMAVVTNNDGTAVEQLRRAGVCQVGTGPLPAVAAIVDSAVVGVAKPDPAIFALALDALGTEASRTLYVGDTVHADVVGARAAGLPVVQLDPFGHHEDFEHHRVRDLDELVDALSASSPG